MCGISGILDFNLNHISALSEKIEKALDDSNFIELASLSSKLQRIVQLLTHNSDYKKNINKNELEILEKLLVRVDQYQTKTEAKFKNYTSRISKQTKMQNAYKHSQG